MAAGFASGYGFVRNVPRAAVNDQSRFHRNQDGKGAAVCLGEVERWPEEKQRNTESRSSQSSQRRENHRTKKSSTKKQPDLSPRCLKEARNYSPSWMVTSRTISNSFLPAGVATSISSPTLRLRRALPMGEVVEMRPFSASASSVLTRVYSIFASRWRSRTVRREP